jgi:predicted Zn-dependent peptidase
VVVSLIVLGLAGAVSAQTPAAVPERPPLGPPRPFQLAPRAERTLPNGLRIIVTQQNVVPKVSVTLTVKSGYSSDPTDLTGLASATGDLIQEGTKTRSSQDIRRQAFGMGGSLTASASQDYTTIGARGLSEFMHGLIEIVADVAMNPTFSEEELGIMKQQRLQGVEQNQASPQFLANREFRKQLFGAHPYARTSETTESVNGVDRAKIVAFHREHYRPNNAFLLVVGDVTPDSVFAAAEKAFGGWVRGTVPQPAFAAPPALAGRHIYFVQRPNSIQSSIAVGNFAVKRSDPRWFEMALANSIYGGAFNSRIVKNIREDKGYTYSPSSQFTGFANAGFYKFSADVRNEVTGATLTEVFKEIDKMRAEGSDGSELAGAKSYMRGVFALQTATQGGLSATLNNVYTFDLPKNYPETFRSTISELTPLRVKNGANALLGSDNTVIVIVGDWTKVKDQLSGYKDMTFLDINGKKIASPVP